MRGGGRRLGGRGRPGLVFALLIEDARALHEQVLGVDAGLEQELLGVDLNLVLGQDLAQLEVEEALLPCQKVIDDLFDLLADHALERLGGHSAHLREDHAEGVSGCCWRARAWERVAESSMPWDTRILPRESRMPSLAAWITGRL